MASLLGLSNFHIYYDFDCIHTACVPMAGKLNRPETSATYLLALKYLKLFD
jgi:hypothetical protein